MKPSKQRIVFFNWPGMELGGDIHKARSALVRVLLQHSRCDYSAATTEISAVLVFHVAKAQDEAGKQRVGNQPAGAGCMSIDRLSEATATQISSATSRNYGELVSGFSAHTAVGFDRLIASFNLQNAQSRIRDMEAGETFALAGELFKLCRDRARADRVGAVCAGTPSHGQFA